MKKTYIAPALDIVQIQVEQMMALSLIDPNDRKANSSDALVKGSNDWDIFGDANVADDEAQSGSIFEE